MPYSQKVLDRFEAVTNAPDQFSVGRFDPNDKDVATGMAGAPACGDVMRLQLKLSEDERITDVKFKTYGCGSAIASASMFVDLLKGKTIEEAKEIKDRDIAEALSSAGCEVDKSEIRLPDGAMRQLGEYQISIQLHGNVSAAVNISIVQE